MEPAEGDISLGWEFERQCRNFDDLKDWAENARAFEGHGFLAADLRPGEQTQGVK